MSDTTHDHPRDESGAPAYERIADLVIHADDMSNRALDSAVEHLDLARVAVVNGQGSVARELLAESTEDLEEARRWLAYL